MAVAVDLGSAAVKVATGTEVSVMPPGPVDPELAMRIGTTIPMTRREGDRVLTQTPHDAYVRAAAAALHETPAELVRIVVPVWWSKRARALVQQAVTAHAGGTVELVTGAEAGLRASQERHRLPGTVAVLDIGAESSSVAIMQEVDGVPRLAGRPLVLHGRAGNDIDRRLMQHVLGWVRADVRAFDPFDPWLLPAGRSLLGQVRSAKEQLSSRPAATVSPELPSSGAELRLVRSELDEVARGTVDAILAMLNSALAAHESDDVGGVVLMGGSVSIPLVPQVISAEVGLPVFLDKDPATLAVRGAAAMQAPAPVKQRRWRRRRNGVPKAVLSLDHAPVPRSERYDAPASPPESVPDPGPAAGPDVATGPGSPLNPAPTIGVPHVVVDAGADPTARWQASAPGEASWSGMRYVRLDEAGRFRLQVNHLDHEVDLGADLASASVTLLLMGLHVFVTRPGTGALVRKLHLDPNDDFRPR